MGHISKNIGFVSTRFSGTDGVTLEASKWADVFTKNGHNCFWFAGKLDRDMEKSLLVPEAYFQYEKNQWINEQILGKKRRNPSVTQAIHELRSRLKIKLHEFINKFNINLLVAENVLNEVKELGIKEVWFQPGSENKKVIEFCKKNKIKFSINKCLLIK